MTFNVQNNFVCKSNSSYWEKRAPYISKIIKDEQPDIVAMQECSGNLLESLERLLPLYVAVFVERRENYYENDNCFFVRKGRFRILDKNVFSLAKDINTPGSKIFGSIQPRKCSYIKVSDGKHIICLFNVHLDFLFLEVKRKQLCILKKIINEVSDSLFNVILGDFNMPRNSLIESFEEDRKVSDVVSSTLGKTHKSGWYRTPIDHIFIDSFKVLDTYKVEGESAQKASDHYPIVTHVYLDSK